MALASGKDPPVAKAESSLVWSSDGLSLFRKFSILAQGWSLVFRGTATFRYISVTHSSCLILLKLSSV